MTKTKKVLVVLLSVLCLVCMGLFTLTACSKKTLDSIKITTQPTKVEYTVGEKFDATGMVVTARYSDNSEQVLESSVWDWDVKDSLTVPEGKFETSQTIKVSYTENKVTKDTTLQVKVTNLIKEATIKTEPDTTNYFVGQSFSVKGLTLDAKLQSGAAMVVDVAKESYTVKPDGALGTDDKEVTVTVGGYSIKVPVKVANAFYVEAETGYRNGAVIPQTEGDSGNLRTDATSEKAKSGIQALYEGHLKAVFAVEKLSEGDDFDADALDAQPATAEDLSAAFGGTATVYNSTVTAGGEIISKLYCETAKWLKDTANKEAIDAYVASDDYKAAVAAFLAGTNEDKEEWDYTAMLAHYTAHAGTDGNEYYLGQNNPGDVISFLFDSSAETEGIVAFRLSSAYLYADSSWLSIIMGDVQFNKLCEFYVNGVKQNIDDSKMLLGGKTPDGSANNILWCNWDEVQFDNVPFVKGRNVIELRILNHGIPAQEGYTFAANIDTLLAAPMSEESCKLNTYPADAKATAKAADVSISAEGIVTITGTYTGVAGYVGDLLAVKVGNASAVVTTDMVAGTFTATVDVSKLGIGDYEIAVTADSNTTVSNPVKVGYNTLTLANAEGKITLSITSDHTVTLNSATIDVPVVTLEERGGKPCMVISGGAYDATVANYTADEAKPLIEEAIKALFLFEAQNNPIGGYTGYATVIANGNHVVNILENNAFEIEVDLSALKVNGKYGVHFNHANEDGTFPTENGANDFATKNFPKFEKLSLVEVTVGNYKYQAFYNDPDCGITFDWGCVAIFVTEPTAPKKADTNITLVQDGDKVYAVINGTYENYTQEEILATFANMVADYQYHVAFSANTEGKIVTLVKDETFTVTVTPASEGATSGTYQVKFDITEANLGIAYFRVNYAGGETKGNNLKLAVAANSPEITVGNKVISLVITSGAKDSWANGLTGINVEDVSAPKMAVTKVELKVEGEGEEAKLYYIITNSYANYTKAELEALIPQLFLQGNPYMQTGDWNGTDWKYRWDFNEVITVNEEDKTFVVKADITKMLSEPNFCYTNKFDLNTEKNTDPKDGNVTDFKPAIDNFKQSVTIGTKLVELSLTKGGGDNAYWGCVGLKISDAPAAAE